MLIRLDLDSLCSAVVAAYLRSNASAQSLHIPLSNLPREDLKLRTEMSLVLKHAGLEFSDLLTLSELPELSLEDANWFLVDQNALTGTLKKFQPRVNACIDHHIDDGVTTKDAKPRVIEHCGSCMSLIVDEYRKDWEASSRTGDAGELDSRLAKLSLAPILIDTINLTAKEKMAEKDTTSTKFLIPLIKDKDFDPTKFHDDINAVKEDISSLTFRDIFRKDYKQWEDSGVSLGISCVVQNFDYLLEKAKSKSVFLDELSAWSKERALDVTAVMTTSHPEGDFQRHLLVWATTEKGETSVRQFIQSTTDVLQLKQWQNGSLDGHFRFAWQQSKLSASRKQVAPLLREAINSSGKERL